MQKWKRGILALCLLAVSVSSLTVKARAETVYADMRVDKMMHDGFIKSDGYYAEFYHSAVWAGAELSGSDTTLARGQVCYCIEPDIPLVGTSGETAYGKLGSKSILKNLTTDQITTKGTIFNMLGRVLQIGGTDATSQEVAADPAEGTKYLAAQLIIWQIVLGDMDENFNLVGNTWKKYGFEGMEYYKTAPKGGKAIKTWYDEWIKQLKNSQKIPSFASESAKTAPTYEMTEETLTLTDNRKVLQYMNITASDPSVKITVSGQKLIVENPNNVDFTVTMTNTICDGAKQPTPIVSHRVSDGEARQTTIVASTTLLADPVQGFFKVTAAEKTGELLIRKKVEQDDLLTSSLAGYRFRVQSTETGYNQVHKTDANGEIQVKDLPVGTYTIEELQKEGCNTNGSNIQFEIPKPQTVKIGSKDSGVTEVQFENQLRRGTLTVYKVDAADPGVKLAGAKLLLEKKVYDPAGTLKDANGNYKWKKVKTVTTGKNGKAVWKELPVGEYRLTETKSAEGYRLLAEPVYFSLPYESGDGEMSWSYEADPVSIDLEMTVGDPPIYLMPSSGGYKAWICCAGFALCAVGMISEWYVRRRRRKVKE